MVNIFALFGNAVKEENRDSKVFSLEIRIK